MAKQIILPYINNLEKILSGIPRWGCYINLDNIPIMSEYGPHNNQAHIICRGNSLISSKPLLSSFEIDLLNKYLKYFNCKYENNELAGYQDFLVRVLGYDKLSCPYRNIRKISTSCDRPYTKFHDYYLMDWEIDWQFKTLYNPSNGEFNDSSNLFISRDEYELDKHPSLYKREMKIAEETDLIKQSIPRNKRYVFFNQYS